MAWIGARRPAGSGTVAPRTAVERIPAAVPVPGGPVLIALLTLLVLATGCSQAAALAPVGGGREALVRFAGNDVLVEQGVPILRAPACTQDASGVVCTGTTADGQPIRFEGPPGDPAMLVVTVGTRQVYEGGAQDVVDRSGRPS